MKPKIFITQKIPNEGVDMLRQMFDVEMNEEGILPIERIIEKSQGKDVIVCLLTDRIGKSFFEACPSVKMVSSYTVGFNNIDVAEATKRNIVVTNTPGTLHETTADLAFALILTVARRVVEADSFMRASKFTGWGPMDFLGRDVTGSVLGIVGLGQVGKEVARRGFRGFRMKVLYVDNTGVPDADFEATKVDMDTLFRESDIVSLHVPLTPETTHLVNEERLRSMKKTSILINTARGAVIDEKALVKVLQENVIFGAGLDVYEEEPKFASGLEKLSNVVMLPHIGSASWNTRQKMSRMAAQNIIDFMEGRNPVGLVNKELAKK